MAERRKRGAVELATARTLRGLRAASPIHAALAAAALRLAQTLDDGPGLSAAAVARELRATLDQLAQAGGSELDDAYAALTAELAGAVPPAVEHPAN